MNSIKPYVLLIVLSLLYSCGEEDGFTPELGDKRISKITLSFPSSGIVQEFAFIYDTESRLSEIYLDGMMHVRYNYNGNLLTSSELFNTFGIISVTHHYIYENNLISRIETSSTINVHRVMYLHGGNGHFTRSDIDTLNNINPPTIVMKTHEVTPGKQVSRIFSHNESDTIVDDLIENVIIYDENVPNPIRDWHFPSAFNEHALYPFTITRAIVRVPEVFFTSEYLPGMFMLTRNGKPAATANFEYTFAGELLAGINLTIVDHEDNDRPSEIRSMIEWAHPD